MNLTDIFKCTVFQLTVIFVKSTESASANYDNRHQIAKRHISPSPINQFLHNNCTCQTEWNCKCCMKFENDFINIPQNLCSNWHITPRTFEIVANVTYNDVKVFGQQFSGIDMPAFCFPLIPSVPFLLTACIKFHSLTQMNFQQLQGCSNATLNFLQQPIVNHQMGCLSVGASGIKVIQPHENENENGVVNANEVSKTNARRCH